MDQQYPIGKYKWEGPLTPEVRNRLIEDIAATPSQLRAAVAGLTPAQLDTPYRLGGWTVRQVVHHIPDSHLNAYIRYKLALTEQTPTIKPYHEELWAELFDAKNAPVEVSLSLLDGLHQRWVLLLRSLGPNEMAKKFMHPELGVLTLDHYLSSYAWHGKHHVAQIMTLRKRMGWD